MAKRYGDAAWRRKYQELADEARRRLESINRERDQLLAAFPQLRAKRQVGQASGPKVLFVDRQGKKPDRRGRRIGKKQVERLKRRAAELFKDADLTTAHVARALKISDTTASRWRSELEAN